MQPEPNLKILCAGCLEWFPRTSLKCAGGHPYCIGCYPSIRVVRHGAPEQHVASNLMRRKT